MAHLTRGQTCCDAGAKPSPPQASSCVYLCYALCDIVVERCDHDFSIDATLFAANGLPALVQMALSRQLGGNRALVAQVTARDLPSPLPRRRNPRSGRAAVSALLDSERGKFQWSSRSLASLLRPSFVSPRFVSMSLKLHKSVPPASLKWTSQQRACRARSDGPCVSCETRQNVRDCAR